MAILKKTTKNKCSQESRERELLTTTGRNVNWCSYLENSVEVPQNTKNKMTIPLLDINLKKTKTLIQKDTCVPVLTEALFTTTKIWKQPKCPLTDEWIKKMYMYTMGYSDQSLSRVRLFATPWIAARQASLSITNSRSSPRLTSLPSPNFQLLSTRQKKKVKKSHCTQAFGNFLFNPLRSRVPPNST